MRIRHIETLAYYDGPAVFEARDTIGGRYIAVRSRSRRIHYLVAGVAPDQLRAFLEGEIDLRHLLLESEPDCRYTTTSMPGACNDELEVEPFEESLEESGFLPDPGFVMDRLPSSDLVGHTSDNRLVLSLDESTGRIGARKYTELIIRIQVFVRRFLENIRAGDEWSSRGGGVFDVVVPAVPGSFRVVLEPSARQNVFNEKISVALSRMDELFRHSGNPPRLLKAVLENGVHVGSAYLKLLQLLNSNGTGLTYAWSGRDQLSGGSISKREAEILEDVLTDEINTTVTLEGRLYRYNTATGYWGLETETGGKRLGHSSRRRVVPDLSGLQTDLHYRFFCEASIVVPTNSETLHLIRYERLSAPMDGPPVREPDLPYEDDGG